ncbi:putative olfactory receptor 8G3 pseudogene [Vombatus ursinus]|uniref:putative olfactory receptor 8G3 pseudogene n=1 Tax=Vombatus ursinus TaxID=29139 RepID=UPI000FFD359E|nr:putative olfactory receptor 8G3 pseudogene [Vombatus ursinus]
MTAKNHSTVTEFILAGSTHQEELQLPLFILFLVIYVANVVGNLALILLIVLNSHLHTLMYYLISNLSFIDLCHSSVITPRMLISFLSETNTISYPECMIQLCFFHIFAIAECHMLAAMAYDRYVAICSPLLYNVITSYQVCSFLVMGGYFLGIINYTIHTGFMQRLLFCKANVVNHYFCDLFPLLSFSCSTTYINEMLILCFSAFNILVPTLSILSSYISIIKSILRIHSAEGRYKAFTTCTSHIVAIILSYGSAMFVYLQPSSINSMDRGKVSSVFYTNIFPMLNPLIYSLRNKDVKIALIKTLE